MMISESLNKVRLCSGMFRVALASQFLPRCSLSGFRTSQAPCWPRHHLYFRSSNLPARCVPSRAAQQDLGGEACKSEKHVEERDEDEEEEFELPAEGISAEEARLTAEYLASLDSQWSDDPPHHRSGRASYFLQLLIVLAMLGMDFSFALLIQASLRFWVAQMLGRARL